MGTLIITFVVLGLVVIAMSVGVLLGGKPISGSCGGMAALGMDVACDICKGDKSKCDSEDAEIADVDYELAVDATKKSPIN